MTSTNLSRRVAITGLCAAVSAPVAAVAIAATPPDLADRGALVARAEQMVTVLRNAGQLQTRPARNGC